jgi:hypothetical protein
LWFVVGWQRLTGFQLDGGLQHSLNFLQRISMLDWYSQQWNSGGFKYLVYKLVPFLAIVALVALVVQFNSEEGTYRLGVAEQKVDMLAVNFVGVDAVLTSIIGFDIDGRPKRLW